MKRCLGVKGKIVAVLWVFTVLSVATICSADDVEELKASDGVAGDYFGISSEISDGYAVIGNAPEESAGKAYIFKRSASDTWEQQAILTATEPTLFDEFGYSVAIDSDYVAVSSTGYDDSNGAVYVFKQASGSWSLQQMITGPAGSNVQYFGEVVAMKGDYLLISTPYDDGANENGAAFLYKRSGDTWNLLKTFTAPAAVPEKGDFGMWADISDNYILISAPGQGTPGNGQAFIYAKNSDSWDLVSTLTPPAGYYGCGTVVALTDNYAALSVFNDEEGQEEFNSAVTIYRNSGGNWAQAQLIVAPGSVLNMFGYALSINDTNLAISDPMYNFKGAVYRYMLKAGQWTLEETYTPSSGVFPSFGSSVSVYNNDYLLAGYPATNLDKGEAYLWRLNSGYLKINVDPASSGTTDPTAGTFHKVTSGVPFSIKATPASGYAFNGWNVDSGTVTITDPNNADTTATVNGNAEITAEFITVASVSFAVSPAGTGDTSPIGTQKYATGTRIPIRAIPSEGYYFSKWIVTGSVILDNPQAKTTNALVNGNCTITAIFLPFVKEVQLTMVMSPDAAGTIQPTAGTHVVESTKSFNIEATPAGGMHFSKWTIQGTGTISDPQSSSTTASITENSTITAFFAQNTTTVTLTMAVSPAAGGTTSPTVGNTTVNANQPVKIEAYPADGYHFVNWSIAGSGSIDGNGSVIAWVTLDGDATVTANFAANSQTVGLTMAVTPADSGTTNPGTGTHQVNAGETYEIQASPQSGYFFARWNIAGDAQVADPLLTDTYIILSGDATVTAVFVQSGETTNLTIGNLPEAGGTTNPGAGTHQVVVGTSMKVVAIPNDGYYFTHWSLKGTSIITDTDSAETIISIFGQSTLTANFAEASASVTLTMQISPDNSGKTDPGAGTHSVTPGKSFVISATPESNYIFQKWQVTGSAIVADPELNETEAVLSGDATITAVFVAEGTTAQLVLITEPVDGGATNPGVGIHTVPVGQKLVMEAIPAEGYYFVSWESDKNIAIEDRFAEKTFVEVSGNTSLVAVFAAKTTLVELTLTVSPENTGTTNPGVGTHLVNLGDRTKIEAIPEDGYHFTGWEVISGSASIDNLVDQDTYVATESNATVAANFAANETPVTLEMKITPENSGFTSPGTGMHNGLFSGEIIEIQAFPADGYHFTEWSAEGANIDQALSSKTLVTLINNTVITANFATNDDPLSLLMRTSDINGGLTYPVPGEHTYYAGESIRLEAATFDDYYFVEWELDGEGYIANNKAAITQAVLTGDSTITAVFTAQEPIFLTQGSVISIDASEYDESRKWVFVTLYNTKHSEAEPRKEQFSNVDYDKDNQVITGEWRRRIRLYNSKDYPAGEPLSELLTVNPVEDLKLYGIYVRSNNQEAVLTDLTGYLVPPRVNSISGDYAEKGDVFVVKGMYFGARTPTVCLEYTINGKVKYKRCKVLQPESLRYMNALKIENKSCMKVWDSAETDEQPVGYSQISVEYPKLRKNAAPTGYVIIKNQIGMAPGMFPVSAE